jgi:cell division protein FtsL
MFRITVVLVCILVIFIFVVDFVLTNIEMFNASFNIHIGLPLIKQARFTLNDSSFQELKAEGIPDTMLDSFKSLQNEEFATSEALLEAVANKTEDPEIVQQYKEVILEHLMKRWSYTFTVEKVTFIYIIAGSVLLGALVVTVGSWVLDAKRRLKKRSLEKELKRLQKSIQEAKSSLPPEEIQPSEEVTPSTEGEPSKFPDSSTATPEDITKSFEDTVEQSDDVLEETKEDSEEETEESVEGETTPESRSVPEYETVTEPEEKNAYPETSSEIEESVPQETPIEAELVENGEDGDEEHLPEDPHRQKKDEE